MLFGENPFNEPENIIGHRPLLDFIATSGCTVVIDGKVLYKSLPSRLRHMDDGGLGMDVDALKKCLLNNNNKQQQRPVVELSRDCFDLLSGLLDRQVTARYDMPTIMSHPWWTRDDI